MNWTKQNLPARTVGPSLTRLRRRIAVLATYLGYSAMVGVWYMASFYQSAGLFILVIMLAIVTLSGFGLLVTSWVWHAANAPESNLDERQQRVRDRAYLHSYQAFAGVITLAGFYAALAWDNGWWLPTTWNQVQAVMWGVLLLALTLPAAVVAWTESDLSDDR
ncbi:MAG: hypothetical protein H7Z42_00075 [Roseiflexaceae bacterium]|nr:hypothetical protein [Roseiflexaceae bacterium]